MTTTATITVAAVANDGTHDTNRIDIAATVASILGANGQRQTLTLSNAFSTVTVPTGAHAVVMQVTSGAVTLTLKGVTGDTGTVLQSGTLATVPIVLPLGTTPSLGLLSTGTATVDVWWV